VNDVSVLDELVAATVTEFARLDVVVNNAGGSMPQPFLDIRSARSSGRSLPT
jgi:NAD(P)-dependent dehydrogenase (short-subunit alcohol dehydrogenase family)